MTTVAVVRDSKGARAAAPPAPVKVLQPAAAHVPQPASMISQPGDPAEKEADRTAKKVMGMTVPDSAVGLVKTQEGSVFRQIEQGGRYPSIARFADISIVARRTQALQRKGEGQSSAAGSVLAEVQGSSGGAPLPLSVRRFMEPRFGADFRKVRIHTGEQAARLNRQVQAKAFATGNNIFFGKGQFQPETHEGRELIAHELTHTIQQGHAIQRSPEVTIRTGTPAIQRLGMQDALDYFADKANYIPGFRLLTIVLGFNPINRRRASRSAANILRALIELLPGGALITQALDNHGVLDRAGAWVEQQLASLGDIGSDIVAALRAFIDSLSWSDVFDLGGVWERAKAIFLNPIGRLISFGAGIVTGLMALVKEAVLRPLARLAEGTAGYDLLKAVLGQDPITGEPVPRTPATLIGGFMKLIGQEEVWENIQKGNAVARAWAWFQGALSGLMGFVRSIPAKIVETVSSITWQDVVTIVGLFAKVGKAFLNVAGEFFSWAGAQVISLLEIIFSVVAPGAVPYIKKAQGAFRSIIQNPIGFIGNLVRAGKLGFQMFASNIVEHLKAALVRWITGPLGEAGVYIPRSFSLMEIVKLVLSVLGLTWQNIRARLVKIIPEPVLSVLEKTASVVVTLVRDGPVAAWEEIKNELNELKSAMIAKVTEMISIEVVKAAVLKLVSMLNPAGAVIQAIIAIYNTITFFIQKINQIAAVVASFIDSIAAIAAGQVDGAARKVEQTMASTLTVIIAFLAKFAGLGNIPEKLVGIIKKIRQPIDKGLDKIVAWLGNMLKKLGAAVKAGVKRLMNWWKKKVPVNAGGERHTLTFDGEGKAAKLVLRSEPQKPSEFLGKLGAERGKKEHERKKPVATARGHEGKVETLQNELGEYDDIQSAPTASGLDSDKADAASKRLDKVLGLLANHIGRTVKKWGGGDPVITAGDISLPRGSFSADQKAAIAGQHPDKTQLVRNSKGQLVNVSQEVGKELARRHVVSAHDMSTHYTKILVGKKVTQAKMLLEQRASIAEARTQIDELSPKAIQVAAKSRYSRFFGYLRNMFIGDSRQNSAIQENLDRYHPDMVGNKQKISEHIRHVKRAWAFDDSFKPTGWDE